MSPETAQRVLSLLRGERPASRNRDFEHYRGAQGRRVHRLYRLYLSLLEEIKRALRRPEARVSFSPMAEGLMVEIRDSKLAYQRTCLVPPALAGHFQNEFDGLVAQGDMS